MQMCVIVHNKRAAWYNKLYVIIKGSHSHSNDMLKNFSTNYDHTIKPLEFMGIIIT